MDSIRSALQPVTHNLPGPIRDLGVSILGDTCYKTLILDIDHTATECIKLAISKGLGIGIIAGSATVKIPQLLKLLSSKSASGVSFLSYLMESSAFLIGLAYSYRQGFPFSTYGENALILAQNVVISVLVLHYSGKTSAAAVFVAGLAATVFALFNPELVDAKMMSYLQVGASILGVGSKVPQILTIYEEGGTGQLSAFAVSLLPTTLLTLCASDANSCIHRCSTTSSDRYLASSQHCRRLTIRWFFMAFWLASFLMQ
jgi:mannose-P-dolichol utilization defect protein 1